MTLRSRVPTAWFLLVATAGVVSCGGNGGPDDTGEPADVPGEGVFDDGGTDAPGPDAGPDAADATDAGDTGPADAGDEGGVDVKPPKTTPGGLPYELPFVFARPDVGDPLTDEEITAFTRRITGFWKDVDYFRWAAETSAGMDASTGVPDYLIWWHDFKAVKSGDTVTFMASKADGGSHNNAVPTGVVLGNALMGHLHSDDPDMRWVTEQYTKSLTACMKGFVHDADDPVDWLIARHIVGRAHAFTLPNGKKKAVDYSEWYFPYTGWNADRFRYPDNPTWGDIWVTNKRSKDDLPYWWRVAAWLPYLVELGKDEVVRQEAQTALELLRKSARDIVESGWKVRTKDENGVLFIPDDQDLASFVAYTNLIPDAECDARLATALLGYGDPKDVDCGSGDGSLYDSIAGAGNYFNYDIITHFHMVAALLALTTDHRDVAESLVRGLATRLEKYQDPAVEEPGKQREEWERDLSVWLLRGAAVGLPLTSKEARTVMRLHDQAITAYRDFPNWDLWDASVPDGTYGWRDGFHPAHRDDAVQVEDIATILEYCGSPFRNPAGVRFVDCDVVLDPAKWGGPVEPEPCPTFGETTVAGTVADATLDEISGVAPSRTYDALWVHEDSGNPAILYALRTDGTLLRSYPITGVANADWEDLAVGPFAGLEGEAIFLADTGNNAFSKPTVTVLVIDEPDPGVPGEAPVVASLDLAYPEGEKLDCESIFVDPTNGDLYLVAKETLADGKARVFRKAAPHVAGGGVTTLTEVGRVPTIQPTGAAIAADGSMIAVRTYFGGVWYRRGEGQTVAEALAGEPCELPPFPTEPQGEAIAFAVDGSGYWTISEKGTAASVDVHFTPIEPPLQGHAGGR